MYRPPVPIIILNIKALCVRKYLIYFKISILLIFNICVYRITTFAIIPVKVYENFTCVKTHLTYVTV